MNFGDISTALRSTRRSSASSAVMVAAFALGIGANVAIFGIVQSAVLNPLPYTDSRRIVWAGESFANQRRALVPTSDFIGWAKQNSTFAGIAAVGEPVRGANLSGRGEPIRVQAAYVSSHFL